MEMQTSGGGDEVGWCAAVALLAPHGKGMVIARGHRCQEDVQSVKIE